MKQKKAKKKSKIVFRKDSKFTCLDAKCFEPFPDGRMGYCTKLKKIISADTHGCSHIEEK